ncbi:XylR N-terminal domain-containing protein [Fictibacillus enclensis]|uniref:XylR N-terminal domain-containing protein n=1 Tax=Fictibacillus enclensis TaxID=1017270 RepID=UPI0024BF1BEF|nr:XylR N-terminal domain-containing protein [Fictibacillus enclensis]WHY71796.1 XylR N-terminal domain-containing protein [Fictibacillus enclensis]
MKPYQLLFENLIDINPRTGMIKFNNKRMALFSVEALGFLRRDLVNTLGMERAKGFLMRYGWACGYKSGENIEEIYEWKSKKDLLLAGPYLHSLEGVATAEPDTIEINEEYLYFTGQWKDSFEAIEHTKHYGHSKDPVCWILVGYASGYLTKTYGKKVLVYEEKCLGKGDTNCRFVAKRLDLSDKQHRQDLGYYETESLLSELDRVYKEVQELNDHIMESEQVQKQLTDMMLADKSIQETVSFIADILQKSIVIDLDHGTPIKNFMAGSHQSLYHQWKDDGKTNCKNKECIETFPIQANTKHLGIMILISDHPLNQKENLIIQRSLKIFTIQLFHQKKLAQSIWEKKANCFDDLIRNKYDDSMFQHNMNVFDFNPNVSNRILTIHVQPTSLKEPVLQYLVNDYPKKDIFFMGHDIVFILDNPTC